MIMKLTEVIGNWLIDLPIVEQAFRRNDVENKTTSIGNQVVKHLIKLYKWSDPINFNHHVNDISSWLEAIDELRIKGSNKPSANVYYKWILLDNIPDVREITKQVKRMNPKYGNLPVARSDDDVYEAMSAVLLRICNDISNDTFISAHSYFSELSS